MNFALHAKAITAFAVSLVVPPLMLLVLGGSFHHILGAALIGFGSATLTATAVFLVPNRTHGFNVNDIAASLIEAGLDAVDQSEEIADEQGRF